MQWKSIGTFVRKKQNTVLCATLAGMMLLSSGFTMNGFPKNMHRVSVHVDGETINDMTVQTQPNDIFAKLGVEPARRTPTRCTRARMAVRRRSPYAALSPSRSPSGAIHSRS